MDTSVNMSKNNALNCLRGRRYRLGAGPFAKDGALDCYSLLAEYMYAITPEEDQAGLTSLFSKFEDDIANEHGSRGKWYGECKEESVESLIGLVGDNFVKRDGITYVFGDIFIINGKNSEGEYRTVGIASGNNAVLVAADKIGVVITSLAGYSVKGRYQCQLL